MATAAPQTSASTGNDGIIGWYVPPWMAEKYPDITDWENLNKYSDLFKTSETGDKGTFYDGDPGFVTNDEAIVKNLDLNYEVVFAGSETALIEGFRKAEENKTPYIGYFYEPQWFLSEVPLVKVNLPRVEEGRCRRRPATWRLDYPPYPLNKVVSTEWAESGSPSVDLVKNFTWTNEDQNLVAKYIAEDKMDPEDAADKWIDDNQDKVDAWLGQLTRAVHHDTRLARGPATSRPIRGPSRVADGVSVMPLRRRSSSLTAGTISCRSPITA